MSVRRPQNGEMGALLMLRESLGLHDPGNWKGIQVRIRAQSVSRVRRFRSPAAGHAGHRVQRVVSIPRPEQAQTEAETRVRG